MHVRVKNPGLKKAQPTGLFLKKKPGLLNKSPTHWV